MKQLLNDWQIKGQQKKQFHGAVKALKNHPYILKNDILKKDPLCHL